MSFIEILILSAVCTHIGVNLFCILPIVHRIDEDGYTWFLKKTEEDEFTYPDTGLTMALYTLFFFPAIIISSTLYFIFDTIVRLLSRLWRIIPKKNDKA